MSRFVLFVLFVLGVMGAARSFRDDKPAKWRRADVLVGGKALSVELPAKPTTTTGDLEVKSEGVVFGINAVKDGALATEVWRATPDVAAALVAVYSREYKHVSVSTSSTGVELAGMRGVELQFDGDGPRGAGRMWVVSDGTTVLGVLCVTDGGLGVGKRIQRMGRMCQRFKDGVQQR